MGRIELAPDVSQVSVARRFVRNELAHVPEHVSADMQLIVSELVTNAVEHGPDAPVMVSVECDERRAAVTVDAAGRAAAVGPTNRWTIADGGAASGRGLGIVRRIADRVEVDEHHDRFAITAQRLL